MSSANRSAETANSMDAFWAYCDEMNDLIGIPRLNREEIERKVAAKRAAERQFTAVSQNRS